MECCICELWARMPYHKRYTTPTTAQETEGALVVGYWLRRSLESTVPRICEKHMAILSLLDQQEEARIAAEQQALVQQQQQKTAVNVAEVQRIARVLAPNPATAQMQSPQQQQQIADLQAHQRQLIDNLPQPPPQPAFALGPGPLLNENAITGAPPLPVQENLVAPYQQTAPQQQALLDDIIAKNAANVPNAVPTVDAAVPGTMAGALEAARMAPQEGQKVTIPCVLCGKPVTTGEVHAC